MVVPQHGGRRFHPQRLLRFTHAVRNLLSVSRVSLNDFWSTPKFLSTSLRCCLSHWQVHRLGHGRTNISFEAPNRVRRVSSMGRKRTWLRICPW